MQQIINTVKVKRKGEGLSPSLPITTVAINFPAPVFSSACAKDKVPPNKKNRFHIY